MFKIIIKYASICVILLSSYEAMAECFFGACGTCTCYYDNEQEMQCAQNANNDFCVATDDCSSWCKAQWNCAGSDTLWACSSEQTGIGNAKKTPQVKQQTPQTKAPQRK